ncbi:hypothetical protein HDU98_000223 [Podochytrium sp. JEL0797]|nr:hypothetical protein HDU98_000223 [Podochytrium sp. JEL0797]
MPQQPAHANLVAEDDPVITTQRRKSQLEANRMMELEQRRRVEDDMIVELADFEKRQELGLLAIQAQEDERTRRVQENQKVDVQQDVVRRVSVALARDAIETERERRVAAKSIDNLPDEIKSHKRVVEQEFIQMVTK